MDKQQFLEQVRRLRAEGKSIRNIATVLGVHRSRVHRAMKAEQRLAMFEPSNDGDLSTQTRLREGVYVGRQQETSELRAALQDVLSGNGRLITVVGEPGIGKTRIVQKLTEVAQKSSARVLWSRCYEQQGAPPYWPWIQAIRAYVQQIDTDTLRSHMTVGAADIAEIVPDLKHRLPDLEPPPPLEPEQARFRLFDSITNFLKQLSQFQPLVLVIEDLHWADRSSLLLLEFLAHEIAASRLLVVGTYRNLEFGRQHLLQQTIGVLASESLFQQVHLTGLMRNEVRQYIELTLGETPPQSLVEAVHERTEGNPFFMSEVVRLWQRRTSTGPEGSGIEDEWATAMPDKVGAAIRRRLSHLSESCNRALTIASIIGREFGIDQLERVMGGLFESSLLEVVDEALSAGIIEEVPDTSDRYEFSHVLVQETLSNELSNARKISLHAEIGEALEALYESETDVHAAEIAHHFAEAGPRTGLDKLARYSLIAGERALAVFAWEDAQIHLERGLAAKEGQPVDEETAALLFGLSRAQGATEQRPVSVTNLRRVFDYYFQTGNVAGILEIVESPSSVSQLVDMVDKIGRALEMVPVDSHDAGRLQAVYGISLFMDTGDYDAAKKAFENALAIASRVGDVALEMRTLAIAAYTDGYQEHLQPALKKSLRVIELASVADEPISELRARVSAVRALLRLGYLEQAGMHLTPLVSLAEKVRDRYWLNNAYSVAQSVAQNQGNFQVARTFSDLSLTAAPNDWSTLSKRVVLEYETGDFVSGESYLERLLEVAAQRKGPVQSVISSYTAFTIALVARTTQNTVLFDTVRSYAELTLESPSTQKAAKSAAKLALGLVAVRTRDAEAAENEYHMIDRLKRGTIGYNPTAYLVDQVLGLLSVVSGKFDRAIGHFEDSISVYRKGGYQTELAWTCHDCAGALMKHNGPGDIQKALTLLEEALSVSEEIGMRPLGDKIRALQEQALSIQPTVAPYPDGLTLREVDVLRLIATGHTNREISENLVLTIRTVERHITNIYAKIHSRGRADATAYALKNSLIDFS